MCGAPSECDADARADADADGVGVGVGVLHVPIKKGEERSAIS